MATSDIKITADIVLNTSSVDSSLDKLREKINNTLSRVDSSGADKGFEKIAAKTRDAMTQTEAYGNRLKSLQSQLQTAISEAHKGNATLGANASAPYEQAMRGISNYMQMIEQLRDELSANAQNASLPKAIQLPALSAEEVAEKEQLITQYQTKIQELEATMTQMESKGTAFPELSQEISQANAHLMTATTQTMLLEQNLESVSGASTTAGSGIEQTMQQIAQSVADSVRQIEQQLARMNQMSSKAGANQIGTAATTGAQQNITRLENAVSRLEASVNRASSSFTRMGASASTAGRSASSSFVPVGKSIKSAFGNTGKFASLVGGKLQSAFSRVKSSAQEAFSPNRIKRGLTTLIKYTFGVRSLFFLFRKLRKAVKEGIENLVQYESKTGSASKGVKSTNAAISSLKTSLLYLKNAWAAAFAPIINAVMPLLTTLIDGIANAANYIAKFVGALTGQKIVLNAVKTSAGDYAKSLDKDSSSADKAAKSQKKLNDRLAQFDDLNVLGKDDDSDSGSGSGNGGGFTPDPADMFTIVGTGSAKSLVDMLKEAWENADFSKIGELLKDKIIGVLDYILDHMGDIEKFLTKIASSIGTFFAGLLSDPNLFIKAGEVAGKLFNAIQSAFKTFLEKVEKIPLGKNLAKMVSKILSTVNFKQAGENINKALKILLNNVKDFFDDTKAEEVEKAIKDFFEGVDVGELALTAVSAVLSIAKLTIKVISDLVVDAGEDAGNKWWKEVTEGIKDTYDGKEITVTPTVDPKVEPVAALIESALYKIGSAATHAFEALGDLFGLKPSQIIAGLDAAVSSMKTFYTVIGWITGIIPAFQFLGTLINTIKESLQYLPTLAKIVGDDFCALVDTASVGIEGIVNAVKGFFTGLKDNFLTACDIIRLGFGALVDGVVSGIDAIVNFFKDSYDKGKQIGEAIVKFFTETIPNAVKTFSDGLSQKWTDIKTGVTNTWNTIKSNIIGAVEGFKTTVETKINAFKSNILGVWETVKSDTIQKFTDLKNKAVEIFNGIKDAIKTPINGILGVVQSMVNKIIGAVNSIIDKLNSLPNLQFKNPFNGQEYKLGFNIPKLGTVTIPRLAEGAVIPPNKEFMAMLGDQSHGTNIEAPLDTIKQAVAEVVGNNGSAEMIRLLQQLIGVVESKQLTIGDAEIGKANARYNKQQSIRRGTSF